MASVFSDPARARLNAGLPPYDATGGDEKACRRRVRDAEWNFRVSTGYEKGTLWNRVKFRMTRRD